MFLETSIYVIQVVSSCILLFVCADILLRGIIGISKILKVSVTFLAFTVVAFGTSFPEFAASIVSAMTGHPDVSIGNVMGSNLFNLFVVVGVSSLLKPIYFYKKNLNLFWLALLISTLIFSVSGFDLVFDFRDGLTMTAVSILIVFFISKYQLEEETRHDVEQNNISLARSLISILFGLVGIATLSDFAIDGAIELGIIFHLSERVIGLTIISMGTSIPEVVTSLVAIKKGHNNIALANVIGSNIINTVGVTGTTALITPLFFEESIISYDLIWVLGVTILLMLITRFSKNKIKKNVGIIFLSLYLIYLYTII